MLNIGLCGFGRVGKELHDIIISNPNYRFIGSCDSRTSQDEVKQLCAQSEIIIDFSSPNATMNILEYCALSNTKLVIGTTGLQPQHFDRIKNAAKSQAIFYSANMLIGINLIASIGARLAQILDQKFDIVISDFHHRYKQDTPSGTALMLADQIKVAQKERKIQFSSIRAGENFGEHEIIFASGDEVITLRHQALNRKAFALGALRAAEWIKDKPPGLYSMEDMLIDA